MVTILSTIFTFLSIYFLHLDKRIHAVISYLIGYVLDCVDGKMARKYSMCSDFGMVLDCTSDNISNLCLLAYLIASRKFNLKFAIQLSSIFIFIYLLSITYGLNEAISSYKKNGTDNIYEIQRKKFKGKDCGIKYILNHLFLFNNKIMYKSYRFCFPTFIKEEIYSKLKIFKQFGPGNFTLFIAILLLFI